MFAGSGAVGIEALSRGAGKVVFADSSRDCCELIRYNLKLLGTGGRNTYILDADLSHISAGAALRNALRQVGELAADVIFADPPYSYNGLSGLPRLLSEFDICAAEGIFIIEHGKKTDMPQDAGMYAKYREKNYGDSSLSFYQSTYDGFFV